MLKQASVLLAVAAAVVSRKEGKGSEEQWQERCEEGRDFYLTTMGNSGQYAYKRCDGGQWLKVQMKRLSEYSTDGKETNNRLTQFTNGDWAAVDEYDFSWVQYTYTQQKSDVTFTLSTRILNDTEQFAGNSTGDAGDMKFSFSVRGWQWEHSDNELRAVLNLDAKGGGRNSEQINYGENDTFNGTEVSDATFEGYRIVSPMEAAYVDADGDPLFGEYFDVDVENPSKGNGKSQYVVTLQFHGDDKDLYYDPLIKMWEESTDDGSDDDAAVRAYLVAAFVLTIVAVLF